MKVKGHTWILYTTLSKEYFCHVYLLPPGSDHDTTQLGPLGNIPTKLKLTHFGFRNMTGQDNDIQGHIVKSKIACPHRCIIMLIKNILRSILRNISNQVVNLLHLTVWHIWPRQGSWPQGQVERWYMYLLFAQLNTHMEIPSNIELILRYSYRTPAQTRMVFTLKVRVKFKSRIHLDIAQSKPIKPPISSFMTQIRFHVQDPKDTFASLSI